MEQREELTGHSAVDAVIESLMSVEDLPLADHLGVYSEAHARLQAALDEESHQTLSGEA